VRSLGSCHTGIRRHTEPSTGCSLKSPSDGVGKEGAGEGAGEGREIEMSP